MERNAQAVLKKALTLPATDRAEVAGALLNSLEPVEEADLESAWRQEVAARVAGLDAGEVETIPWSDVRDRLVARLVVRQSSFDRVAGEDFASLARRSDAGVAGPTSRRSNAASGVKDRQDPSNEG